MVSDHGSTLEAGGCTHGTAGTKHWITADVSMTRFGSGESDGFMEATGLWGDAVHGIHNNHCVQMVGSLIHTDH